jgi:tetratricopeptide (TPR) repeat protein
MRADPAKAHSTDWAEARESVAAGLERMLPQSRLDELDAMFAEVTTKPPEEIISMGEGWGGLEALRGETTLPELPFPVDSIGCGQQQWLSLLRFGFLPEHDVSDEPGHYMVQPEWQTLLEDSIAKGRSDHWFSWLHLGVMKLENFDPDGARAAWMRSIEHKPSGWAYRNLAVLETRAGNDEAACELLRQAWETGPRVAPLAIEFAAALEKTERWDGLRDLIAGLPESSREHERILIVSAKLALHYDDLSQMEKILGHEFATIREGEVILSDLWFTWQAKLASEREGIPMSDDLIARMRSELTPPLALDMRMVGEPVD